MLVEAGELFRCGGRVFLERGLTCGNKGIRLLSLVVWFIAKVLTTTDEQSWDVAALGLELFRGAGSEEREVGVDRLLVDDGEDIGCRLARQGLGGVLYEVRDNVLLVVITSMSMTSVDD